MKVETKSMINGETVTFDSELTNQGLCIYEGDETENTYICKGGSVVYVISVEAYRGEGGGGAINIVKAGQ